MKSRVLRSGEKKGNVDEDLDLRSLSGDGIVVSRLFSSGVWEPIVSCKGTLGESVVPAGEGRGLQ